MSPINAKAFISLIFILEILNSLVSIGLSPSKTVRLEKDDNHSFYIMTKDGQITDKNIDLDPESFYTYIRCYSDSTKIHVSFEIKYSNVSNDMLVYLPSDSSFPRSIQKNDFFIPKTKDLVLYSNTFDYDPDPKICKHLNSVFAKGMSNILEMIRTSYLQFFKDVYQDLRKNHFKLNIQMYQYPFDHLTPKRLSQLNMDFKGLLKEWAQSIQITEDDFEIRSYTNPLHKEAVNKSNQIMVKVDEFCTQREEKESKTHTPF